MPSGILVFPAVIAMYYNRFSNSLLNEIPVELLPEAYGKLNNDRLLLK
jgi:hypothetical protein